MTTGLPFIAPRRRSGDYTTPADAMAPLAAMLAGSPTVMAPALIAELTRIKGREQAARIADFIGKVANK